MYGIADLICRWIAHHHWTEIATLMRMWIVRTVGMRMRMMIWICHPSAVLWLYYGWGCLASGCRKCILFFNLLTNGTKTGTNLMGQMTSIVLRIIIVCVPYLNIYCTCVCQAPNFRLRRWKGDATVAACLVFWTRYHFFLDSSTGWANVCEQLTFSFIIVLFNIMMWFDQSNI